MIVVGAKFEDSSAPGTNGNQSDNSMIKSGAAYTFDRSGTKWSSGDYLKPAVPGPVDASGTSVAISGSRLIVDADGEDGAFGGVNGDETGGGAGASGAAYVFKLSGLTWHQTDYLKAPIPKNVDRFGSSVAIDGSRILVGAELQDGNAFRVDGVVNFRPGADNSGAAFTFDLIGGQWQAGRYLKGSATQGGERLGRSVALYGDVAVAGAPFESSSAVGTGGDPTLGGTLLVDLTPGLVTLLSTPVVGGTGTLSLPVPATAAGVTLYAQALATDLAQPGGVAWTTGLRSTICP